MYMGIKDKGFRLRCVQFATKLEKRLWQWRQAAVSRRNRHLKPPQQDQERRTCKQRQEKAFVNHKLRSLRLPACTHHTTKTPTGGRSAGMGSSKQQLIDGEINRERAPQP
ncbi:hypothetical protein HUJ05_002400 [Dendroctonus ponderosae]|nr:hypothetical protein HUJ05_002400 [Dendroctonus ponderosae]